MSYGLRIKYPPGSDFVLKPDDYTTKLVTQGTLTFSGDQTQVVSISGITDDEHYVVMQTISVTGTPTPHTGSQFTARISSLVEAGKITFESIQSSGLTQQIGYTVFLR